MSPKEFRFQATTNASGKIELDVPVPPGTAVEVVVLTREDDDFSDLVEAASSSLEFWDNPWDGEDWNDDKLADEFAPWYIGPTLERRREL